MSISSSVLRRIEYGLIGTLGASFGVLLIGACLFGFQFAQWAEWKGGLVGILGTIAGIAGAVIGSRLSKSREQRTLK
ncbi:MAG TPA: hypothetical protein VFJ27_04345 [Terriglobia bacterium]|nr:hypothetical protein [Terriglobia bacterium]